MPTLYTVKQSAELLGVSTATVRRIADEFAAHMPDYQPSKGKARQFTDADLRTIHAIQSRLMDNPALIRADVLAELSAPGSEPLIIPAILPTAKPPTAQDARREAKAQTGIQTDVDAAQNVVQAFWEAQANRENQIEKLSAQIERIAAERSQPAQAERRYPVAVFLSFAVLLIGVTTSALFTDSRFGLACSVLALLILSAALIWPSMRR